MERGWSLSCQPGAPGAAATVLHGFADERSARSGTGAHARTSRIRPTAVATGLGASTATTLPGRSQGAINITAYSKVFEGKIASMKEKQYDGAKNGGAWRTDTMNYLIGRAPDIQHLLQWAESRNHGSDPKPITSRT